jgi:folate-binding protein YgfZ
MNDIAALGEGQWQWNGWLTPKGRVIALMAVLRTTPDTVWLVLQDADPGEFTAQLQRFVFRSKLTLRVRDDLRVAGRFAAPGAASGAQAAVDEAGAWSLDLTGDGGPRTLMVGASIDAVDDLAQVQAWRAADLAHGLPRLDASQQAQWTPQQLSLDRLRAYSVRKGCYPGQEIVARTHFLGQAKRGLVHLEADAALAPGAALRRAEDGDGTFGEVVAVAGPTALAVASLRDAPAAPARDAGRHWEERPLLGGLAR